MSIFEELRQRVVQHDSVLKIQLRLLAKAADEMVAGFGGYLGLPAQTWTHPDGTVGHRYVRLGVGDPNNFVEKSWLELSSYDGRVDFSLALTIDPQEVMIGRKTIVFEFSVRFVQEGYEFKFNGPDTPVILSAEDVKMQSFEKVYQVLVSRVEALFDSTKIEIVS